MGMDVEEEEEEVLFPPSYYVQSPSPTISNTPSFEFQHTNQIHIHGAASKPAEASRRSAFSSSRCSSTRESHMSNALDNKSPLAEINSTRRPQYTNVANSGTIVSSKRDDDDDDDGDSKIDILGRFAHDHEKDGYEEEIIRSRGFRKYLSFGTYDGSVWLAIQLSWRFMVSLAAALLVFYLVTKPPSPRISVKVGGVREFELAEGVDGSGVSTKIMSCNTSIEIVIDNHSKVFGLHILPPLAQMSFQRLTFALSQGEKVVAEREHVTALELYLGTKSKPMYGAGRMMQDLLDSGSGLPLALDVTLVSNYRVVGGFVRPWYHHHARCLLVVVKGYDYKRRTHHFNTTCSMFTSH